MKFVVMISLALCVILSCNNSKIENQLNPSVVNYGQIEVNTQEALFAKVDTTVFDSTNVFLGIKFGETQEVVSKKLYKLFFQDHLSMNRYDDYTFELHNQDGTTIIGEISTTYYENKLYRFSIDFDSEKENSKVVWKNAIHFIENSFKNYYYFVDSSSDNWHYNFLNNSISGSVLDLDYSIIVSITNQELFIETLKDEFKSNKQ